MENRKVSDDYQRKELDHSISRTEKAYQVGNSLGDTINCYSQWATTGEYEKVRYYYQIATVPIESLTVNAFEKVSPYLYNLNTEILLSFNGQIFCTISNHCCAWESPC